MIDLHVHTHHSCDSKVEIEEYCEKAIQLGLKYICFTDHVDFNKADYGYGYYDASKFFSEFNKAKDKYSGKLNILSGIEFAEPHIHKHMILYLGVSTIGLMTCFPVNWSGVTSL